MVRHLPIITTNSERACFLRCQREHHYSYVLGYRAASDEEAFRFGNIMHVALEAWWKMVGMQRSDALTIALEMISDLAADETERTRAEILMRGYDARWADEAKHYDVLGVELEFCVDGLAGKFDALVRDRRDGRVYVVEHKTTSRDMDTGSVYWQRLTLDSQVSAYYQGAKSLGYDVAGVLYDVIGKPALRPSNVPVLDENGWKIVLDRNGERVRTQKGKWRETGDTAQGYELQTRLETAEEFALRLAEHVAANPDRYYRRGTVVRLEAEEADAARDIAQTVEQMERAITTGVAPRNTSACERFNRLCSYFPVCSGTASLDDETLYRKVERVHEELSAA